jgi:hypothetical protein
VIVVVIQGTSGVPYTELSASSANLWRDTILSIAVASAVAAALATWWGWWQPALFERTRARRWTVIAPALVLVFALSNLVFTCLAFGLMHSVNIFLGAPVVGTLQQIVLAGAQGSAFYALRRVSGSLIWAMALHGLWDFSVFMLGTSGGANPFALLTLVSAVVSVVFGFLATKDASGRAPAVCPAADPGTEQGCRGRPPRRVRWHRSRDAPDEVVPHPAAGW